MYNFFNGSLRYFLVPFRNVKESYESCVDNLEAKCKKYSKFSKEKVDGDEIK